MTNEVAALRESVARLIEGARHDGIEPDGPLGRWLAAQAGALESLAFVLQSQADRADALLSGIDAAAKAELAKAAAALEQGRKAIAQGEVVLAQARAAQYHLHLSEQTLVSRLVNDTLPLFAQHMKEALVIRERRWNQDKGRQRMALAGAVTLAVFLSGFVIRTAVDWDRLGLAERCAAHPMIGGDACRVRDQRERCPMTVKPGISFTTGCGMLGLLTRGGVMSRRDKQAPWMGQSVRLVPAGVPGVLCLALVDAAVAQQATTLNGPPVQVIPYASEPGVPTITINPGTPNPFPTGSGSGPGGGGNTGDSDALTTLLGTSWGSQAVQNAEALGVNPSALAATCVLESGCSQPSGGSGGAQGVFQMFPAAYQEGLAAAMAANPQLASQIVQGSAGMLDPTTEAIAASGYLMQANQYLQAQGISNPIRVGC